VRTFVDSKLQRVHLRSIGHSQRPVLASVEQRRLEAPVQVGNIQACLQLNVQGRVQRI